MARDDTITPAPAPGITDAHGNVKVPTKWNHLLRESLQAVERSHDLEEKKALELEGKRAA